MRAFFIGKMDNTENELITADYLPLLNRYVKTILPKIVRRHNLNIEYDEVYNELYITMLSAIVNFPKKKRKCKISTYLYSAFGNRIIDLAVEHKNGGSKRKRNRTGWRAIPLYEKPKQIPDCIKINGNWVEDQRINKSFFRHNGKAIESRPTNCFSLKDLDLDCLSNDEMQVIGLIFWQNEKMSVIAKEMMKSESTIYRLKLDALRKLRENMES